MRSLQKIPPSMIEQDERAMPPGGGLLIAFTVSLLFWGALVWLVL